MNVCVYRNLQKKCWSVMDQKTRRVIAHREYLVLRNGKFVVREGGRQRVLREHQKNVHAFAVGEIAETYTIDETDDRKRIFYNPYVNETFIDNHDRPVTTFTIAWFHSSGEVFAK